MLKSLKQSSGTLWIATVAVTTTAAFCSYQGQGDSEPSYEEIYAEYQRIFSRTREFAERDADDDEWCAFEQESAARLEPIVEQLQSALDHYPRPALTEFGKARQKRAERVRGIICRPLFHLGRDHLPALIATTRQGNPFHQNSMAEYIEFQLEEVRQALAALRDADGNR